MNRTVGMLLAVGLLRGAEPVKLAPATMKKIGTVDERFQSFNVEMVEVTGGRFWAPYKTAGSAGAEAAPAPKLSSPGIDPSLFRIREPIDLTNRRLRKLAAALAPAYVRVSGTWANSTYFHDSDEPAPATPPPGFGGILTRQAWRGVIDFSQAVDAKIVTSFAISDGARNDSGVWTPAEARKFMAYTQAAGGSIAAAEFFNEPTFAALGSAPKGYDAARYGADFAVFRAFVKKAAPAMLILGPGSVGEGSPLGVGFQMLKSEDLLKATGRGVDAFSYHYYGGASKRCAMMGPAAQRTPEGALSEEWLAGTDQVAAYYEGLRDKFEPGKPMWLTETAETACGGNPWASTFVDSFRYLDQLGRLAKRGVQVVAHNTLSASDYGLIDEETMTPRPNYWAALLWARKMGPTVLDAGPAPATPVHLYAHCLRGQAGGVGVLAINLDREAGHAVTVPMAGERYTLTAANLLGTRVDLNGNGLKMISGDELPSMSGQPVRAGTLTLAPLSISFLTFPNAANASCRN